MRMTVWFSNYGLPKVNYDLPYNARSPVSLKKVSFKTEKDIFNEVETIFHESKNRDYKVGESLYYQLPFFCDPSKIIPDWCWDMISDYFSVKKYNIPISKDLDSADSWMMDCFAIIENEIDNISKHERGKNGS